MVVCINNLTVKYTEGEPVLDRFSLKAAPGELVYLNGPTGCGKSTLLNVLSGVIPHIVYSEISGDINVAGINPTSAPIVRTGKTVGHLFQNIESQLFTDRVEDEVALPIEFGAVPSEDPERLMASALENYGLGALRKQNIRTLSSGYKQRLALASLHLPTKAVLLLDEPFSYLDDKAATHLQKTLQQLKKEGLTILVADHRDRLVSPIADRIIRMGQAVNTHSFEEIASSVPPGSVVAEAKGLRFSYSDKGRTVLRDINLVLRQNDCVVVQGENGCGKTTLCLLLAGLLKPSSGRVAIARLDAHRISPAKRPNLIGLALQNPDRQLFSSRVDDGLSDSKGEQVLRELGLYNMRNRHPRSLSFGQKRRLALARILAKTPKLMIVDEPSIGQDTASLMAMMKLLAQYRDRGGSLLLTTHDDRVVSLIGCRIVRI